MNVNKLTKSEVAARFMAGANCSQCVLCQCADVLGYDEDELQRIAAAFGGGMFIGDTCGAVTGALMAIGMAYGGDGGDDAIDLVHEKVAEFRSKFTERFTHLNCREQLGYDFSDPAQKEEAFEKGVTIEHCPALVIGSLEILDEMFSDL